MRQQATAVTQHIDLKILTLYEVNEDANSQAQHSADWLQPRASAVAQQQRLKRSGSRYDIRWLMTSQS